jgi:hypothetical protein
MDLDVLLIYRLIPRMHELLKVTFFLHLIFLLNGIDNLLSNLTWTNMCVSSIDWYLERMIYLKVTFFLHLIFLLNEIDNLLSNLTCT